MQSPTVATYAVRQKEVLTVFYILCEKVWIEKIMREESERERERDRGREQSKLNHSESICFDLIFSLIWNLKHAVVGGDV